MSKMHKRTIIRAFERGRDDELFIRVELLAMEGPAVLGSRAHTFVLYPGTDLEEAVKTWNVALGGVNVPFPSMLAGLGLDETSHVVAYPELSSDDVGSIKAKAAQLWTPEVMARVVERQVKLQEEAAAAAHESAAAQALDEAAFIARAEKLGFVRAKNA